MKRALNCVGFLLALNAPALTAEPVLTATVTGGQHDLKNVIVAIPMSGVKADDSTRFQVNDVNSKTPLVNQYLSAGRLGLSDAKPELLALIPEMSAGGTRTLEVSILPPPPGGLPAPLFAWHELGHETIELRTRGVSPRAVAKFTRFVFDPNAVPKAKILTNPTIKPYHHVFDPSGKILLTNGPDGVYPHHRGIFYGFNQISYQGKKADVWHCRNGEHEQAAEKQILSNGNLLGLHRIGVEWDGQDGAAFAHEERELAFAPMPGGLLVDFRSLLKTDIAEGVKLDGDPQHAGFHFRASAAVEANAKQTYFLRPDGKGKEGVERNWDPKTKKGPVNLPWNAMCFVLDGKRYTVVYLDHPNNPKEARQSERTYGRIGTYFQYQLKPDRPLYVQYRLWIQPGEISVEQCEALSQAFVEPVKVAVK
jgi:hypothetical protein